MIVVDNDVISYFWLQAGRTEEPCEARKRDGERLAESIGGWRKRQR